jgi:S-adenosylmethionine:tRNA ribosyltransferase-isomerase
MARPFEQALALYDYAFPPELIARAPASPRDSAGLVVFDRATGKKTWTAFREIGKYLPKGSVLVLNETKVIPARLPLQRSTGAVVEALFTDMQSGLLRAMVSRRLKPGETLSLDGRPCFAVEGRDDRFWLMRPLVDASELPAIFERFGKMPLPPYIKDTPLSPEEQRVSYQSVFAKEPGSIAAPTASLHFTEELLRELETSGIPIITVTLHVHLGTFMPLNEVQWESGRLHTEEYHIDPEAVTALESARRDGRPLVAVGTTAARTLESAFDISGREIIRPAGETDLFIRDGYRFRAVEALITNFHVPKSSLLMLVCAFAGRESMLALYAEAIERKWRLFSFGDAMLIV